MEDKETLKSKVIESLRLEVNGRRAHYLKAGSGPALVLVHGGASDARDWIDTMNAYADRFTFYAPDLIGFGESERDEKGHYLTEFRDFLMGFIETLDIQQPALIGHSFGGRVCLDVACANQDKIRKLVLIDTSGLGKISLLGGALFGGFAALRTLIGKKQPFPKFLVREGEDYNSVSAEILQSLKVPTLLFWKSFDPYMPVKAARRAQKLIPGARLVLIPGYGHAPFKQKDSSEFYRILLEFLNHE
jgi:pimeloyl-ACP methyl ester carboxylesterase